MWQLGKHGDCPYCFRKEPEETEGLSPCFPVLNNLKLLHNQRRYHELLAQNNNAHAFRQRPNQPVDIHIPVASF